MSKRNDRRAAKRLTERCQRSVTQHNTEDALAMAWAAVVGGDLTYREYCLLKLRYEGEVTHVG